MIDIKQLLPGDIFQALMNASSPSAANPVVTISAANALYVPLTRQLTINGVTYDLSVDRSWTIPTGTGTVTSFSAGTLSPLFTTGVASSTTTPALSFILSSAAANTYFGNSAGAPGAPSYISAGVMSKVDDTNVTLSLSANAGVSLLKDVTLTIGWTGTLADARVASSAAWNGAKKRDITFIFDGQGATISASSVATYAGISYTGVITGWEILEVSDTPVASDIVIDVWKDTYANYPPTVADTIFGTKPSLTASIKNAATGLAINFTQGDIFKAKVDSVTSAVKVHLRLYTTVIS